jgi:hypothetical protein
MIKTYIHPQLGVEERSISGGSTPEEEYLVDFRGRKVLCIMGYVCIDTSCCGTGSWSFIQVIGYLKNQNTDETGKKLSEVETIDDREERRELIKKLTSEYPAASIEFPLNPG